MTPSHAPGRGKTSSTLLVVAILLFVVTRCYMAFILNPRITDITLYFDYAARAIDRHETPYRDYAIEYPPVAWWTIAAPRLLDGRRLVHNQYYPAKASTNA